MVCPYCGKDNNYVDGGRQTPKGYVRYRKCAECDRRFTTTEVWDVKFDKKIKEKCGNCIYCKKLYVPPTHKDVPKEAFVCTYFEEDDENTVMYLKDDNGLCEVFTVNDPRL